MNLPVIVRSMNAKTPSCPWWLRGAVLMLAIGAVWSTRLRWLPPLGTSLNISGPISAAPSVLILPGSEKTRSTVAAELLRKGLAEVVIIPETRPQVVQPGGVEISTAEATRQILLGCGVPSAAIIILPSASESTVGDALALRRHFQQQGATDVIVVTHAYHTRRARWTFRQILPEHQQRLQFYAAPNEFDDRLWWTSRRGRQCVLSEWLKYVYYIVRYGHGWVWGVSTTLLVGAIAWARHRRKESEDGRQRTPGQSP